jgi:hypothetical protein
MARLDRGVPVSSTGLPTLVVGDIQRNLHFSGCSSVWPEYSVRIGEAAGSNPVILTEFAGFRNSQKEIKPDM